MDIGAFFGYLVAYFVGLVVVFAATSGRNRYFVVVVYLAAPIIWFVGQGYFNHLRNERVLKEAEKGRRESEQAFIRFCKERGESIAACQKHRAASSGG